MLKGLNNISKSQSIMLAFTAITIMLLFSGGIIWNRMNSKDKTLKFEESLDIEVKTIAANRGFLLLNEEIAISASTPMIKEISKVKAFTRYEDGKIPNLVLGQILAPYRKKKEASNDTIIVYSHRDTIYFRQID